MKIYFVGYMFSGKSSVGKKIAKAMGFDFYDLDTLFERKYKISIADFFSRYDEAAFRKLEHEVLLSTKGYDNCVIATGGGTPCFEGNMDFILENGLSVYLKSSVKTILNRRSTSKRVRPILANKSDDEALLFVERQLAEREPFYQKADLTIKAESVDIEEVIQAIQSIKKAP